MKRIFLLLMLSSVAIVVIYLFIFNETKQGPLLTLELLGSEKYSTLNKLITSQQDAYEKGEKNEIIILRTLWAFQSSNDGLKEKLDKWVEQYPDTYPAYLARGSYYVHNASLARGANLSRKTHKKQFSLMRQYQSLAKKDLNKALSINKKLMFAYSMLLRITASNGTWKETLTLAQDALTIDPASYMAHVRILFKLQPKWGGNQQALEQWLTENVEPYVKQNPPLKALLGYRSFIHADKLSRNDQFANATAYYDKAVEESNGEDNIFMIYERGENYYYQKKYDLALIDLNEVLKRYPYYTYALRTRGRVLHAMKRYNDALEDYTLAVSLDQYHPKLRRLRSYLYRDMKKPKLALADINSALKYGVYNDLNWGTKGSILLYDLKNNIEAVKIFEHAAELDPKDASYWYSLGVAHYNDFSCDFVKPLETYLELCNSKSCQKELTDWSKTVINLAFEKGFCERLKTSQSQ